MPPDRLSLRLRIAWVVAALSTGALLLIVAGVVSAALAHFRGHDWMFGFAPKVDLDKEGNLPTYYSSVLLLTASALAAVIALGAHRTVQKSRRRWWSLAAILLLLSVDEAIALHELMMRPMRNALGLDDVFYFVWVIPGGCLVLVFAVAYVPFIYHLPARERLLIVSAGAVFIGGALGMEVVGGIYTYYYGGADFVYALIAAGEEGMEMAGVILLIYAFFGIILRQSNEIEIQIST